ncbi:transcription factor c2h2 protein [Pochonia chlamydosporia 170]|uniref:Transcription factor c2h2 protein n=1 Tax=Pochonia chlamydosporia 170 TaxID=1380566 RepID=A0A179G5C9_METCM|nr:transcription factor c2h2 protein [Pochonia chlamydosporia 170]OAQ72688.2 transcription factor c2h2 protein [Pochonia chlamydosporia 170]
MRFPLSGQDPSLTKQNSAVAIQFDASFAMGPRSAFTWPGSLDAGSSGQSVLGTDLSSLVSGSEASLTPPSETRSLASSPPRGSMTPEEQEMKRHRDRARREVKMTTRMRRTDSASYTTSPPPIALNDVSSAIPLPLYSTAPSVSILADPSPALHNQTYLSTYNHALQDASHTSQLFTSSPYQQSISSPYSMSMDYPGTIYSSSGDFRNHIALVAPLFPSRRIQASFTPYPRLRKLPIPTTAKKVVTSELCRVDQNLDAGSTAAMADNSPPLATYFDISERNRAKRPKHHAQTVELNSHELRQEMDTCCTISVSSEEATTKATKFIGDAHQYGFHD